MLAAFARPGLAHVRAAALLARFASVEEPKPWLARASAYEVSEQSESLETDSGPTRARLYSPRGIENPPALVVVPGVHRLGVDEPRLQRFARAIAASGVAVLTPEVKSLTEYRIEPFGIATIGAAASALAKRQHVERVGVMGMSFAGGLALLAAADERYRSGIGFVVAVGAHDDLARVGRFFVTNAIPDAEGHTVQMQAHDYGIAVLMCDHADDFFPPEDAAEAKETLRRWLWGEEKEARARAAKLQPASREKLEQLFDKKTAALAPEILRVVEARGPAMREVSPHGRLGALHVPVYLLHGAGDSVIPPTETGWLAKEVPPAYLRTQLISPAVQHVELHGEPTAGERWALVHFMAQVLEEARDTR
ncbi:hypothetical protein [Pendulispora albinea]|uniref:Alpha/beta hydrolase n=1 Tax=Pendulispora albinea TaxID=2741071 RepID=A0ABZ2LVB9_9BACT